MRPPSGRSQMRPSRRAHGSLTASGRRLREVLQPSSDRIPTPGAARGRARRRLIQLGGQKQRALLAALLVRVGEVVSTDRLIDDLWGEEPPRTAATSLQNFVSQLRKLLGPEVLVTRPPGYALDVEREAVDAARFERLVAEASGSEPPSASSSCARLSRCGEASRWPSSPTRRSRRPRSADSRSYASPPSRSSSTPSSSSAGTQRSSASWSRSSRRIRYANGCGDN